MLSGCLFVRSFTKDWGNEREGEGVRPVMLFIVDVEGKKKSERNKRRQVSVGDATHSSSE